jgi:hypothetical protein
LEIVLAVAQEVGQDFQEEIAHEEEVAVEDVCRLSTHLSSSILIPAK